MSPAKEHARSKQTQSARSRSSNLCCVQAAHPQSGWVSGDDSLGGARDSRRHAIAL
jgi:hypothetical protein